MYVTVLFHGFSMRKTAVGWLYSQSFYAISVAVVRKVGF